MKQSTLPLQPALTYFREPTFSNLLYTHILLMSLAWIIFLPLCIILNTSKSSLRFPFSALFLTLNAVGTIFGLAYNSNVEDLYEGSIHGGFAWGLTVLVGIQFCAGFWCDEKRGFFEGVYGRGMLPGEGSLNSIEGSGRRSSSESMASMSETDEETLCDIPLLSNSNSPLPPSQHKDHYNKPNSLATRLRPSHITSPQHLTQILETTCTIIDYALLFLGYIGICTGMVTLAGIFKGNTIFNGLAHTIKGSIFFFFGILTLLRFLGLFSSLGWAWNLKSPSPASFHPRKTTKIGKLMEEMSMEFIESFFIFLYGITNVFLEHLANWGGKWVAQDLEHVAISLLFIGGGLCGMLTELKVLRKRSGTLFISTSTNSESGKEDDELIVEQVQKSMVGNPMPVLVIFLLGIILAGHHQANMESTMMHKFFGNFLTGASAARCFTYVLLYIQPITSTFPSRPPLELITSFCLIGGGIMLMLSNRDTVNAMIENEINAVLVATVTMGVSAICMAWATVVTVIRGWARKGEMRYFKKMKENSN